MSNYINKEIKISDSDITLKDVANLANNCLVTGSYGLGSQCKAVNGDLNTACGNETGFYRGAGLTNKPTGSGEWIYIIHLVHDETYKKQIAFDFFSNAVWIRTQTNGNWGDWQTIIS